MYGSELAGALIWLAQSGYLLKGNFPADHFGRRFPTYLPPRSA